MRETFLYSGTYEDIIQTLGRWRILELRSLLDKVEYKFSYQAFAKMVSKLERLNYVGSIYYQGYRKYLYLTEKGLKEAGLEKSWPINKEVLLHDLICVNVFSYLLGLGRFGSGGLNLEEEETLSGLSNSFIGTRDQKQYVFADAITLFFSRKAH